MPLPAACAFRHPNDPLLKVMILGACPEVSTLSLMKAPEVFVVPLTPPLCVVLAVRAELSCSGAVSVVWSVQICSKLCPNPEFPGECALLE